MATSPESIVNEFLKQSRMSPAEPLPGCPLPNPCLLDPRDPSLDPLSLFKSLHLRQRCHDLVDARAEAGARKIARASAEGGHDQMAGTCFQREARSRESDDVAVVKTLAPQK